ncbi:MAG: DUF2007 domain-containing protein [Bacteroidales bacterium]|nr:DUF2007 domain-containing protein [Bacteroidales bacterium]
MNKKIMTLESQFEAQRIKNVLDRENIPHIIRSFHDSAYDGLFQGQQGWGVLMADKKNEKRILELVGDKKA